MIDLIAAAIISLAAAQSPDTTTVVTVQEDSPQWDCTTMGNRICGVGNAQVVCRLVITASDNEAWRFISD
jgi:hypothetical protein